MIEQEPSMTPSAEAQARMLARLDTFVDGEMASPPVASQLSRWWKPVSLFLAGMLTGGISVALLAPKGSAETPALMTGAVSVVEPSPAEPQPPGPLAAKEIEPPPPTHEPRTKAPSPPLVRPAPETSLEAERRLLEPARTALARSRPTQALELIKHHHREFPGGLLAEERDALWVQALSSANDLAGAKAKAEEFRARYPDSFLLPVVERAISEE